MLVQQRLPGFVIKQSDVVSALLQLLYNSSSCLRAIMNADRDRCVDFGACDLLEQFRTLALCGEQEGVELALCEEHRSPELIECEIGSRLHGLADQSLASRHGAAVVKSIQRALLILKPPICPTPRAIGLPADAVALAILPDKIHLGISAAGASAQDCPTIMNRNRFSAGVGRIFPTVDGDARIFAIEREAQRIEDGGFPSAGLACDSEKAGTSKRPCRKINLERSRKTCQMFAADSQNAHGLCLRPRSVENIQMRGIRRDAERAFKRKLEQILRISLGQPDHRIGKDHFM
ncbi:protein of unknown function (plasmid) [Methylocella tundrae]|uniref:Uncharacterized protein n=1 Tax=Methylocella tundrae TaxID=227605 RepID=A0A4U8Z7Z6_METTU|nr:protein of unknown function [Methylocella tundrae]